MATPVKISSDVVGMAIAEEARLKVLPASPVWYEQEPNSFSDFGATLKTVARNPINASRQRSKGSVVDVDAKGGFSSDFTQNNMTRLLQGFYFADAHELLSTAPLNGTGSVITSVTGLDVIASAGMNQVFAAGDIVKLSNFESEANNVARVVQATSADRVSLTGASLVGETPPASAKVEKVGFSFPAADLAFDANSAINSTATNLTTVGFKVGAWCFFESGTVNGYFRVRSITANKVSISAPTFTAPVGAVAGVVSIYFGTFIVNESVPALIKRRSYSIERTLGDDGDGIQSETLKGSIPNEFVLTLPKADKLTCEMNFVSMDSEYRDGSQGVNAGARVASLGEDAFNTSSDIYLTALETGAQANVNNPNLFAYVTEMKVTINNNITPDKAVGVVGAFDATVGDFAVSATVTAYFATVESVRAIRSNTDAALFTIFARDNAGMVFDIPLLSIGGGQLNIEKGNAITVPLETNAAKNSMGYTTSYTNFAYLPDIAMPA